MTTARMTITAAHIKNFKRITDVSITPGADRAILLIGGKNGQGKSSTLDALTSAFGGKKSQPADPVRHGAEEAEINIELDGGELTVRRVIQPDGESQLEVRDRMGAIKAPQDVLNRLIGTRFLDPLAFVQLPAKEQRAQLMKLIPEAERIADLNTKRERAFTRRTEVGRDLTKAEGELARLPAVEVGTAIDVGALMTEAKQITERQRAVDAMAPAHADLMRSTSVAIQTRNAADNEILSLTEQIEKLQDQLAGAHDRRKHWGETVKERQAAEEASRVQMHTASAALAALDPRRAEIDVELARAGVQNRKVVEAESHMKRRLEAAATVEKLTVERDSITKTIDVIDTRKAEILTAAKLPVEGLSVDDDGVTLNGVPFAQASGAEKLRVALAVAIAGSPGLADVWIRDGALLDDESLELVKSHAKSSGNRVWIERVGTADEGVIVISDGTVAAS